MIQTDVAMSLLPWGNVLSVRRDLILPNNNNTTTLLLLTQVFTTKHMSVNLIAIFITLIIVCITNLVFISADTCSRVLFLVSGTNENMKITEKAQMALNMVNVHVTPSNSEITQFDDPQHSFHVTNKLYGVKF